MSFKIKNLFFDLDGTILDTSYDLCEALNYALRKQGLQTKTIDEIKAALGNGLKKLAERSVPEDTPHFETIFEDFKTYYSEHLHVRTRWYPGIEKALKKLKNSGFDMFVISNKFDPGVQKIFEFYNFGKYFTEAVGESKTTPKKPDPSMINYLKTKYRLNLDESLLIGDSQVDIQTARNCCIKCACVTWGFRSKDELLENNPDFIIDSPEEIVELLQTINHNK